jgi:hypothetical protein
MPPDSPPPLGEEFSADLDIIHAAIARGTLFNVIHRDAIVKVDVIVRKNTAYRIEEFRRRRIVDVDGHPLWMIAPEDLILSKRLWAKDSRSELQLRDVRGILALQGAALDAGYLDRWATSLSVDALLREVQP